MIPFQNFYNYVGGRKGKYFVSPNHLCVCEVFCPHASVQMVISTNLLSLIYICPFTHRTNNGMSAPSSSLCYDLKCSWEQSKQVSCDTAFDPIWIPDKQTNHKDHLGQGQRRFGEGH